MKYKVGDLVRVIRGPFEIICEIKTIDKGRELPYHVEGAFTRAWISEKCILGVKE